MEFVEVLITIVVVCILLFGLWVAIGVIKDKNDSSKGIIYSITDGQYYGGFDNMSGGTHCNIDVEFDCISFNINGVNKVLPTRNIVNLKIQNETQIQRDISIGKIFMFGLLAFGSKKNKTIVQNYLLIEYKLMKEKHTVIVGCGNIDKLYENINKVLLAIR